jgi:hypothetical protein
VEAEEKVVELNLRKASVDEVVPFIERAGRWNTGSAAFDARQVAESGARFVLEENGKVIAGWVLEIRGDEVFIKAAAGTGKHDFTKIGFGIVEGQAAKFDSVGFHTKRRALVDKALKQGYKIDGWIMRKKLK